MKKHNVKPYTYCRPTLKQAIEMAKYIIDNRLMGHSGHDMTSLARNSQWLYSGEKSFIFDSGFSAFNAYDMGLYTEISPEEFMKQLKNEDMCTLSEQVKELERENKELKARLEKKERPKGNLDLGGFAFVIDSHGYVKYVGISPLKSQYGVDNDYILVDKDAPVSVEVGESPCGGTIITFPYKD